MLVAGKIDLEDAAGHSCPIMHTDPATKLFHEDLDDVQPQSGPFLPTGELAAGTKKHLKNPFSQFVRNPLSVIQDPDDDPSAFCFTDLNFNAGWISCIFDRVIQQIPENRLHNEGTSENHHGLQIILDDFRLVFLMMSTRRDTTFS